MNVLDETKGHQRGVNYHKNVCLCELIVGHKRLLQQNESAGSHCHTFACDTPICWIGQSFK